MIILPAIDILNGTCVRLVKGEYGSASKVAADPAETAKAFAAKGASFIHIVDLDGAKDGRPVNNVLIADVCRTAASLSVKTEVGGGIRNLDSVEYYLENGIDRVILGSAALYDPQFVKTAVGKYGSRIAVGIDAKNGFVSTSGWLKSSEVTFTELALAMADSGVDNIIFTDIDRDGTLAGPCLESLSVMKEAVGDRVKITASGGIRDIGDIKALAAMKLYGAIAGKAIYSGTLPLEEAIICGGEWQ